MHSWLFSIIIISFEQDLILVKKTNGQDTLPTKCSENVIKSASMERDYNDNGTVYVHRV